jgi:predicted TIM-barrel fold metal-dependent hydrolase
MGGVIDVGVQLPGPSLSELQQRDGSADGDAVDAVIRDVLDDGAAEAALLTPIGGADPNRERDPYRAADLARATNDHVRERWLSRDQRLWGSIVVSSQLPERAAMEIRRLGGDRRFRQVVLSGNAVGRTFGHAVFRPIFDAAVDNGLPVAIRAGEVGSMTAPYAAGGAVSLALEQRTLAAEGLMTHLVSLVANGLFDRHPSLNVVLWGGGVSWLAPVMWRFEMDFKGVRREVPWVARPPTEYLVTNVRVVTHPLEEAPRGQLAALAAFAGGEDVLVYGSGYPGADADRLARVRDALPAAWHERVFHDNAARLYA